MSIGKQNRGRDYWAPHVMGWRESGSSQSRYCEERGLSVHALRYWHKRLKTEDTAGTSQGIKLFKLPFPISGATTGPLNFPEFSSPRTGLLVHVGQHRIEVTGDFEPFILQKLVHTLRGI